MKIIRVIIFHILSQEKLKERYKKWQSTYIVKFILNYILMLSIFIFQTDVLQYSNSTYSTFHDVEVNIV